MTRKTISKKANSKGTVFALVSDGVTWEVWKLCENYCGQVRGGITKTWRCVQAAMGEQAARDLFARRIQGTQR